MKPAVSLLAGLLLAFPVLAPAAARAADAQGPRPDLAQTFLVPPDESKPWAYWWWLNANVTPESITRDLEEMKAKGLGGFLLFDVTSYGHELVPPPPRRVAFMSDAWRGLVRHAMTEAGRLGLQMSMNLSTCGGSLQAPWDMGEHAPKQLVWTKAEVRGPARIDCLVKPPKPALYWEVAVLAVRHGESEKGDKSDLPRSGPEGASHKSDSSAFSGPWSPALFTLPKDAPAAAEVVDLTPKVDARGRLAWDVPEGRWTIVRFGCETIEGHSTDVDILNPKAVAAHFERIGRVVLRDAGPLGGKTLSHFYNVSWEGATPTWTPGFEDEFRKYRAYDPRPMLPVLAGIAVGGREASARFARDHCRTLSDCFLHNSYGQFTRLCHEAGLKWHSESGGPWRAGPLLDHADQLAFWGANDMPQGEFWWPSKTHTNARRTAMAAHIYGKPLASIEAFTHMQPHWSAYPAAIKPLADAAFCDGVNHFVWHTFSASPPEFGKPGIVYFAGTHLNPNVTWWEQSGPMLAYLARCQFMLRQGHFVADACCYVSDRNRVNWTRGERWSEKPSLVLPKGHAYDLLNTEVLVERLSVEGGDLVLPGGMRYRLLVVDLDEEAVPPEALAKILDLARSGATVVLGQRRPTRAPGLKDYPACDEQVRRLAAELWGEGDAAPSRALGKGRVLAGAAMDDVLKAKNILPDAAGPWDFIHRRAAETDIYFVAGSGSGEMTFRVQGKEPELWDPKTGRTRGAVLYRTNDDGRTTVPLALGDSGSVFVVFRRPAGTGHFVSLTGPEGGLEIEGRSGEGAAVRLWQNGRYVAATAAAKDKPLAVEAADLPEARALEGPWDVRFAPGWGAPESIQLERLVPWNEHPHEAVKHFSGTATYRKSFELSAVEAGGLVRLHLGELRHVGRVRVNGQDLGVLWTAPWQVELSGAVKPGQNDLEIDVTNTWANRLIGDAALDPDQRRTKTNVVLQPGKRTLKPFQAYGATDPLMRSGLIGPVRLEFGRRQVVPLSD